MAPAAARGARCERRALGGMVDGAAIAGVLPAFNSQMARASPCSASCSSRASTIRRIPCGFGSREVNKRCCARQGSGSTSPVGTLPHRRRSITAATLLPSRLPPLPPFYLSAMDLARGRAAATGTGVSTAISMFAARSPCSHYRCARLLGSHLRTPSLHMSTLHRYALSDAPSTRPTPPRQSGFVSYSPVVPESLLAVPRIERGALPLHHLRLMHAQLQQFRNALFIARALGRALVLPETQCSCEIGFWPNHIEVGQP